MVQLFKGIGLAYQFSFRKRRRSTFSRQLLSLQTHLEQLEPRTLLTVVVNGTEAADSVRVWHFTSGTNRTIVTVNGVDRAFVPPSGEDIVFNGLGGDDFVRVQGSAGHTVIVNGGNGNDITYVLPELDQPLSSLYAVVINGGPGIDSGWLSDYPPDNAQTTYSVTSTRFSTAGLDVDYDSIEDLEFATAGTELGADIIVHVLSTAPGMTFDVVGTYDFTVYVGNGDLDTNLGGPVMIHGADSIHIDDQADTGSDTYTLSEDPQSFRGGKVEKEEDVQVLFDNVNNFTLNANSSSNVFNILGIGPNAVVNGSGGNDTFHIGPSLSADLTVHGDDGDDTFDVLGIANHVLHGGNGMDRIEINDGSSNGSETYDLTDASLTRTGILPVPFSSYDSIEQIELIANRGSNIIEVTPSSTTRFFIRGGEPLMGSVGGDYLSIEDSGLMGWQLQPVGAGNGVFTFSNRQPVEFDGIEQHNFPISVTLSLSSATLAENGGTSTVTATLSTATSSPVTVNLGFTGTATNIGDYIRTTDTITIPAGSLSGSATVVTVNDPLFETEETIVVDITTVVNATEFGVQQLTTTITDDDLPGTSEFLVNTVTASNQQYSAVSRDASGRFVVAWEGWAQDGDGPFNTNIYGQRYSALGEPLGAAFIVNTSAIGTQRKASVAMSANGSFVVAWQGPGDGEDVFARRFDANGQPLADEFRVNMTTGGHQWFPSIAIDASGDFVVTWMDSSGQDGDRYGIFAQRFYANGDRAGSEFQVNTYAHGYQSYPETAMNAHGDFIIAWEGEGEGSNSGIFAQRYNSSGNAQGDEFRVSTNTLWSRFLDSVAMNTAGQFVVAWLYLGPASQYSIYAQLYDVDGAPIGTEFKVNSYESSSRGEPSASMDANGNFVIIWQSLDQDGSGWGIYGRRYNGAGIVQGNEFAINSTTAGDQQAPAVSMGDAGDFFATWHGNGPGDVSGIFARRFEAPTTLPGDYNGNNFVDAADFAVWRNTLGLSATPFTGADGDGDGVIDQDDYGVWKANFGMTLPAPGAGSGAAPPGSSSFDVQAGESAARSLTESSSASVAPNAHARAAGFAALDALSHGPDSAPRLRERLQRNHVLPTAANDLLLLAVDRAGRLTWQNESAAGDRRKINRHVDDADDLTFVDLLDIALEVSQLSSGDLSVRHGSFARPLR